MNFLHPRRPAIRKAAVAFATARQPLAQGFQPRKGGPKGTFVAIVNHFKSKGSGSGADAGYVDLGQTLTDKETYQFGGMIGSLDHAFASNGAAKAVTGADDWNINAYESVAREYSRFNYNVLDFYNTSQFRSSDHDPIVIGIDRKDLRH